MLRVYIENKPLLTKLITYLDQTDIEYTTNLEIDYDQLLVAELTKKTIEMVEQSKGKNIIFITTLEEKNIIKHMNNKNKISKNYFMRLTKIINLCKLVIVHMPSIKNIIENKYKVEVEVIPKELPIINISRSQKDIFDKYGILRRKKRILILDINYENLDQIYYLATENSKYYFLILGYASNYQMTKKNNEYLKKMPKNVGYIKYLDLYVYCDLCKICQMVIFYEDNLNQSYLDITLLFKKLLFVKQNIYYAGFLIDKENTYYFKSKEQLSNDIRKRIDENNEMVTEKGYQLIKNNAQSEIIKKYNLFLH